MPSSDPDERAAARVGSVLNDKWTLEKLLGIGGMAAVYAGVHRNGARAAIKVLHPALARRPDVKERFMREGYAANRVNHSGVVKVMDDDAIEGGEDDGGAYLVMELLEGQSVEDRVERGPPIEERELLSIVRAVLDVLDAAHNAGVVHRDLKPENLFLARDPDKPEAPARIKILDFGLARVAEGGGNKTMAGMAIGTPSYMPPEQAAGRVHDIDARSDLFALGASCFRILTGRTVHPADTPFDICARMAAEPAPKLRSVAPNISEETASVIDRALAFRREDRWKTAAAMRKAVDGALSDLGGDTITIESGMLEVVEPSKRAEPPSLPSPPREETKKGGSSWLFWLVLLALLGVGVKLAIDHDLLSKIMGSDASADASPAAIERVDTVPVVPDAAPLAVADAGLIVGATADAESDVGPGSAEDAGAGPEMASQPDAEALIHVPAIHGHSKHDGGAHHGPHGPRHHQ